MSYARLRTTGFLFTQTGVAVALLTADYGDGFGEGALIGGPAGLRSWDLKIDGLPDSADQVPLVEGKTRANYLWDFFLASKAAGNRPFWVYDHRTDQFYLASFVADDLSYAILCAQVYSTGLQLKQRRAVGQASPLAGVPILDEAGAYLLDEAGNQILDEGIY